MTDGSAADQDALIRCALARFSALERLHEGSALEASLAHWVKAQFARCADPAFAALFSEHLSLPGVADDDYLHKLLPVEGGLLLGGIRFYGRDPNRPFVEIMAWTGDFRWPSWSETIRQAWAVFHPARARLLHPGDMPPQAGTLDQTIHAGRLDDMACRPGHAAVSLEACADPAFAAARVTEWYRDFAAAEPEIAAEIHPADEAELAACLASGTLHMIRLGGEPIGLIATERGAIDFLEGHIVIEEILAAGLRGRGLAKHAQRALAKHLIERDGRTDGLMIGTIHRANAPSRRTAINAGRPAALAYSFLCLDRRQGYAGRLGT